MVFRSRITRILEKNKKDKKEPKNKTDYYDIMINKDEDKKES